MKLRLKKQIIILSLIFSTFLLLSSCEDDKRNKIVYLSTTEGLPLAPICGSRVTEDIVVGQRINYEGTNCIVISISYTENPWYEYELKTGYKTFVLPIFQDSVEHNGKIYYPVGECK